MNSFKIKRLTIKNKLLFLKMISIQQNYKLICSNNRFHTWIMKHNNCLNHKFNSHPIYLNNNLISNTINKYPYPSRLMSN